MNSKAQKILGKKYVRGKPYYKIKWAGKHKDEATWESPPSLLDVKPMINAYEIRLYRKPLDEKFFDEDLYQSKNFPIQKSRSKDRKARNRRKRESREEMRDDESIVEDSRMVEVEEYSKQQIDERLLEEPPNFQNVLLKIVGSIKNNGAEKVAKKSVEEEATKKQISESGGESKQVFENSKQELTIAKNKKTDLVTEDKKPFEKEDKKVSKEINMNDESQTEDKKQYPSYFINMPQKTKRKKQSNYYKGIRCEDYGLFLPKNEPEIIEQDEEDSEVKKLAESKTRQTENQFIVEKIFHLEKGNGIHKYLVEYSGGVLIKMSTEELIEKHPSELVNYLEVEMKAKNLM